jgi:Fur family ferric uptake transcriptional regulator
MRDTAFKTVLNGAGYKATPARLSLLAALRSTRKPLSVQALTKRLKGERIDQVTVYRTLRVLAEMGIVRHVDLRHPHAHFELNTDDHHHLVCTQCGAMEDFSGCRMEGLVSKVLKKSKLFKQVREHSLELFGTCTSCAGR